MHTYRELTLIKRKLFNFISIILQFNYKIWKIYDLFCWCIYFF